MLMYGVLTCWPAVSACKCVERECISNSVGCWPVRTPCVVSAKHVQCSHSLAIKVRFISAAVGCWSVRCKC